MHRWLLLLDPAAVLVFVAIGRDTHEEEATLAGLAETAAPFLVAVVIGWLVVRAWTAPTSSLTGAGVLATTVVLGMLLRNLVFGEGTAATFVLVATVFLAILLLGWRLLAAQFTDRTPVDA